MKNPEFIKLICILIAGALVWAGYMLLPRTEDLREHVFDQSVSDFTKDFHLAEKINGKERLPDIKIMSREGREVDLAAMAKGRITVVNFWATWCAPCLEEMPSLSRLQMANADILVVPISLDMNKTLPELARFFEHDNMRDLRWFYDSEGILRKHLALPVYPATYVLDKQGNILYKLQGPSDWSSPAALNFIQALSNKY